jgi:parallel beta-helix repeat protein
VYPSGIWIDGGLNNVLERNELVCGLPNLPTLSYGISLYENTIGTTVNFNTFTDCYRALLVQTSRTVVRGNKSSNSADIGIFVLGAENTIRSNSVERSASFDMVDYAACGVNEWRQNSFQTDNEGDGPNAGCIR